jgi:hypothetical protein
MSQTGQDCLSPAIGVRPNATLRVSCFPDLLPYQIELQGTGDAGRHALESFIHNTFKQSYGADIHHFLPRLMSLSNHKDELIAAVGFHPAQNEPLFLEQYLDRPIEDLLSCQRGHPVQRGKIMEVGNLAVATAGGARGLIIALTSYIKGAGFDWVVFTAVPSLINSFRKMGLEIIPLVEARKERLVTGSERWGSYYDSDPVVVAGNVNQGFANLEKLLTLEHGLKIMHTLWNQAYAAGCQGRAPNNTYLYDNRPVSPA